MHAELIRKIKINQEYFILNVLEWKANAKMQRWHEGSW
jgi:hypothetical protein